MSTCSNSVNNQDHVLNHAQQDGSLRDCQDWSDHDSSDVVTSKPKKQYSMSKNAISTRQSREKMKRELEETNKERIANGLPPLSPKKQPPRKKRTKAELKQQCGYKRQRRLVEKEEREKEKEANKKLQQDFNDLQIKWLNVRKEVREVVQWSKAATDVGTETESKLEALLESMSTLLVTGEASLSQGAVTEVGVALEASTQVGSLSQGAAARLVGNVEESQAPAPSTVCTVALEAATLVVANGEVSTAVAPSKVTAAAQSIDGPGKELLGDRGALVALSSEKERSTISFLRSAYHNFGENKMRAVQTRTPNLLHSSQESEGFSFCKGPSFPKKDTKDAESQLKEVIKRELCKLGHCSEDQSIKIWVSFVKTTSTDVQEPHIDYKWKDILPAYFVTDGGPRSYSKAKKFEYWVPFIAIIPLTPDGLVIEVWPPITLAQGVSKQEGSLVQIDVNNILLLRADVVHAGGFATTVSGNPRVHLYVARDGAMEPSFPLSNCYDLPNSTIKLSETHIHAREAQDVNNCNFFREREAGQRKLRKGMTEAPPKAPTQPQAPPDFADLDPLVDGHGYMPPVLAEILPKGDGVTCHYDSTTLVLFLDFTLVDRLTPQHKESLGRLFEQPLYTVVCKGMLPSFRGIEEHLKGKEGLLGLGNAPHNKCRLFDRTKTSTGTMTFQERAGHWKMRPKDYFTYLDKHYGRKTGSEVMTRPEFSIEQGPKDHDGTVETATLDATKVVVYMLDVDMPDRLQLLNSWYKEQLKLKEVLPGGDWCVMGWVSEAGDHKVAAGLLHY